MSSVDWSKKKLYVVNKSFTRIRLNKCSVLYNLIFNIVPKLFITQKHTQERKSKKQRLTQRQRQRESEIWRNLEVQRRKGSDDLQLPSKTVPEIPTQIHHLGFSFFLSVSDLGFHSWIICMCLYYVYMKQAKCVNGCLLFLFFDNCKWVFFVFAFW